MIIKYVRKINQIELMQGRSFLGIHSQRMSPERNSSAFLLLVVMSVALSVVAITCIAPSRIIKEHPSGCQKTRTASPLSLSRVFPFLLSLLSFSAKSCALVSFQLSSCLIIKPLSGDTNPQPFGLTFSLYYLSHFSPTSQSMLLVSVSLLPYFRHNVYHGRGPPVHGRCHVGGFSASWQRR